MWLYIADIADIADIIYILIIQKISNYEQNFYLITQSNGKIENRDYIIPLSTKNAR